MGAARAEAGPGRAGARCGRPGWGAGAERAGRGAGRSSQRRVSGAREGKSRGADLASRPALKPLSPPPPPRPRLPSAGPRGAGPRRDLGPRPGARVPCRPPRLARAPARLPPAAGRARARSQAPAGGGTRSGEAGEPGLALWGVPKGKGVRLDRLSQRVCPCRDRLQRGG